MSAAEKARARANANRLGKSMAREADKDILALRKAADELDALAAILAEAPHAEDCDLVLYPEIGLYPSGDSECDCWKSKLPADALTAVKEAVWDEVLDEIEEHEINTAQAREGNPYRAERESGA